jgi:AP-4 complex subunit mu-1
MYVHNEPIAVESMRSSGGGILSSKKTMSSTAVQKPISLQSGSTGGKNEIFVDILERLTVLFNANGYVLNSSIEGCIQMKSYLSGNPGLRIALNEDLIVGKDNAQSYGGLVLDDCNFHECINVDDFEQGRTLALIPPDGEFVAMNYRITSEFRAPFRIFPTLEETSQYKVDLVLRVRNDVPEKTHGSNVTIRFPVPKTATSVTCEVFADALFAERTAGPPSVSAIAARGGVGGAGGGGRGAAANAAAGTAEFNSKDREVVWNIKKFPGGSEATLRARVTLSAPSGPSLRKELGPISLAFEIPNHNVSGLAVRYLRIAETHKNYQPRRWVRYVVTSNSYTCRT